MQSAMGKQGQNEKTAVKDSEKIEKVTMYVEKDPGLTSHRYYVVIETEEANVIVSEQLRDSSLTWKENPADIEDRNSLAKAYRSKDCRSQGVTVGDFKAYSGTAADRLPARDSKGKRYAQGAYDKARGDAASTKAIWESLGPDSKKLPAKPLPAQKKKLNAAP